MTRKVLASLMSESAAVETIAAVATKDEAVPGAEYLPCFWRSQSLFIPPGRSAVLCGLSLTYGKWFVL